MDISEIDHRSRDIFREVVESYLSSGDPVGSRTLSKISNIGLSAASIRNIMADLEDMGLLYSPHTSAGRLPTETGLRMFVDGLLQMGDLTREERESIQIQCNAKGRPSEEVMAEAGTMLSGLSACASVVLVPKHNAPLKHIEFINLNHHQGLVVLVLDDGSVENRVINLPAGLPPSALQQASNYLNAKLQGRTLNEAREAIEHDLAAMQTELDNLTQQVVKAGVAEWSDDHDRNASLIVRGRSNLIENTSALENLELVRQLFDDLEKKRDLVRFLDLVKGGDGVKIFIGAENKLFSLSGSSVIVSPFKNESGKVLGAVGVIGPTRLNYGRIIPMVDYTAKMISKIL